MLKKITFILLLGLLMVSCVQTSITPDVTQPSVPTIALPTREPTETPEPLEQYLPDVASPIEPAEMAGYFTLPQGYLAQRLAAPAAADLVAIARSQTNKVYLQQGGLSAGISLLDPGSGEVTGVLSTIGLDTGRIFNGPGESILLKVGNELWRLNPDGSHELWSVNIFGIPLYYSGSGEIYGTSDDRHSILRQAPGSAAVAVSSDFEEVTDLVVSADGTIYVVDGMTNDLVRVDTAGNQMLVDASVPDGVTMDIALDAAGNLYRNSISTGFAKVDLVDGGIETLDSIYSPCTKQPGDFIITENGMVIFIDATASQVVWGDLAAGQTGVLISNEGFDSGVTDVGPDGALYIGVSACGGAIPSQIVRVGRDGSRSVAYDSISGRITAMTYNLRGGIFLATASTSAGNRLWYYPAPVSQPYLLDTTTDYEILSLDIDPNTSYVYATLSTSQRILVFDWQGLVDREYVILPRAPKEYDLAVDGDGQLYGYMSEKGRYLTGPRVDRYLLKLIPAEAKAELIESYPLKGCCPTGSLVAELDGTLWLLLMPEGQLLRILSEEDPEVFAQNLPNGTAGLAVNLYGDIFLTTPSGIYRFYRNEEP
jgi:DNA-binding beta-propeller fold protein YncE